MHAYTYETNHTGCAHGGIVDTPALEAGALIRRVGSSPSGRTN